MTAYGRPAGIPSSEGVVVVQRLLLAVVVVIALVLPGSALANPPARTVESFPADFVLSSQQCPNLPSGTTITSTGQTGRSVTVTTPRQDGTTTVFNSSIARGAATDQDGNRYRFLYSNQFRVRNTKAEPALYAGSMVDVFLLRGRGPARLTNGFLAHITTDLGESFTFDPIFDFGDPINFETGAAVCDPL